MMAGEIADEFLSIVSKLAEKHPDIYEKDKKFFPDEIEVLETEEPAVQRVTYKDMVRKEILDRVAKGDDAGSDLDEEEELRARSEKARHMTYAEEQEMAKKEMLAAAWESEDEEDEYESRATATVPATSTATSTSKKSQFGEQAGLVKKTHSKEQRTAFENEYQAFLRRQAEEESSTRDKAKDKKTHSAASYWTRKDLDKDEMFLRDYVLNKRWLGTGDARTKIGASGVAGGGGDDHDDDDDGDDGKNDDSDDRAGHIGSLAAMAAVDDAEDTKELERQDDFEMAYNFRYEDPNGIQLVTHARDQESVRVEKNKRAEKRARARERKRVEKQAAEEQKIEEKKKRKAEILARVSELSNASGLSDGVKST